MFDSILDVHADVFDEPSDEHQPGRRVSLNPEGAEDCGCVVEAAPDAGGDDGDGVETYARQESSLPLKGEKAVKKKKVGVDIAY